MVRTLAQQEKIMSDLKNTVAEIRDGWVRIEMVAKEILVSNPDSQSAKDAKDLATEVLTRDARK